MIEVPQLWLPDRLRERREDERLMRGRGGLSRRWMPGNPCCCSGERQQCIRVDLEGVVYDECEYWTNVSYPGTGVRLNKWFRLTDTTWHLTEQASAVPPCFKYWTKTVAVTDITTTYTLTIAVEDDEWLIRLVITLWSAGYPIDSTITYELMVEDEPNCERLAEYILLFVSQAGDSRHVADYSESTATVSFYSGSCEAPEGCPIGRYNSLWCEFPSPMAYQVDIEGGGFWELASGSYLVFITSNSITQYSYTETIDGFGQLFIAISRECAPATSMSASDEWAPGLRVTVAQAAGMGRYTWSYTQSDCWPEDMEVEQHGMKAGYNAFRLTPAECVLFNVGNLIELKADVAGGGEWSDNTTVRKVVYDHLVTDSVVIPTHWNLRIAFGGEEYETVRADVFGLFPENDNEDGDSLDVTITAIECGTYTTAAATLMTGSVLAAVATHDFTLAAAPLLGKSDLGAVAVNGATTATAALLGKSDLGAAASDTEPE